MPLQEIPQAWRKDVCAVLAKGTTGREIVWTLDAAQRYEASFISAFQNELYPIFRTLFQGPPAPKGCPVKMERPAGETFEFYFQFKGKIGYGKVLLHTNKQKITIFSAHLPLKAKLSCE
ncbi:hypothetical protein [Prosthecobacter sp.]|uniref:hypothetical protein n=1 Tax=Prosthecobacter sp. TaxID=1965333 RepID=UPI003784C432